MVSVLKDVKKDFQGKANITVVDANKHNDVAAKYKIRVVPTIIFLDKDGNIFRQIEGPLTMGEIKGIFTEMGVK
jgi:thioredoxin 1